MAARLPPPRDVCGTCARRRIYIILSSQWTERCRRSLPRRRNILTDWRTRGNSASKLDEVKREKHERESRQTGKQRSVDQGAGGWDRTNVPGMADLKFQNFPDNVARGGDEDLYPSRDARAVSPIVADLPSLAGARDRYSSRARPSVTTPVLKYSSRQVLPWIGRDCVFFLCSRPSCRDGWSFGRNAQMHTSIETRVCRNVVETTCRSK